MLINAYVLYLKCKDDYSYVSICVSIIFTIIYFSLLSAINKVLHHLYYLKYGTKEEGSS